MGRFPLFSHYYPIHSTIHHTHIHYLIHCSIHCPIHSTTLHWWHTMCYIITLSLWDAVSVKAHLAEVTPCQYKTVPTWTLFQPSLRKEVLTCEASRHNIFTNLMRYKQSNVIKYNKSDIRIPLVDNAISSVVRLPADNSACTYNLWLRKQDSQVSHLTSS